MQIPDLNYKKIAIRLGCMFVGGILFAYVIFPPLFKAIFRSQVILKPGTKMRDMYITLPFPLIFKVHFFHINNPDEVHAGGKPHLSEVGPYVFEEWKDKIDYIDNVDTDTLEFTEKKTFYFSPELSSPLTGNEEITILHPLLAGIPLTVNVDRAPMLPMISKSVDAIFHEPKNIFWTGMAMDIMFNGILLDCSSNDFSAKAVCSFFEGDDIKAIWKTDEKPDHFKFAIFGGINGTDGDRFKTLRGVKNLNDLGRVVEFNGESILSVWDGDDCNTMRGSEGSIFPPFRANDDSIWAFEAGICRSMMTVYKGKSKYGGLPTSRHVIEFGDLADDETQHCYCNDGECPPKGTIDLFPCLGSPIFGSMPHFLDADPELMEKIASGLTPDKAKHSIYLDMEAISGTPLSGFKRLQLNMEVQPLEDISYMHNLPEMLFPFMWIEEGASLNKTYVNMLKYQLFLGLKLVATVKWICIIVGSIGGIAATVLHFKQKDNVQDVVTMVPNTILVKEARGNDAESGGSSPTNTHYLDDTESRF